MYLVIDFRPFGEVQGCIVVIIWKISCIATYYLFIFSKKKRKKEENKEKVKKRRK